MKPLFLSVLLLCCYTPIFAQSADAVKYAPRPILLLSGESNVEAVMPMVFTSNGQEHLEFVPSPQIKESMLEKGGKPIRLGDVLSALGDATQTINKLQAENAALKMENERLWKIALKNNPSQPPPTIVIQQPVPQQPSPLDRYLLLRSLVAPSQPQTQTLHVTVSDCTRFPALCVGR